MRVDMSNESQLKKEIELDPRLKFSTAQQKRSRKLVVASLPWVLVVILSFSNLYLHWQAKFEPGPGNGWETDFGPAKSALRMKQVRFTGSPAFTENGTFYVPNSGPVQYVGIPSPEIDEAWHQLTKDRYIKITEEEAKNTWPENYRDFWDDNYNAYIAGLDLFHTLHCVDMLRRVIHSDHYGLEHHAGDLIHNGHCIDQIRQYVMCSGDITPLPTKYYMALDSNYVDSDVPHTCRDFDTIRQWISQRIPYDSDRELAT